MFRAPKAYDVQRYEAGWNKNPCTLKTLAVPVANAAFAQELIIGSFYGALQDPTIVLVNTKTRERFCLKQGESTASAIRLAEVNVGKNRKETFVQVSHAGETVKLHYDVVLAPTATTQTATPKPVTSAVGAARRLQIRPMSMPLWSDLRPQHARG